MNGQHHEIVEGALSARTLEEADAVQKLIAKAVGKTNQRPLGNTWNNQGILTGSGASYDHKSLEVATNMQDAVLELLALRRFGTRDAVPYRTPHEAAEDLTRGMPKREVASYSSVTIDAAGAGSDKKRVTLVMRDQGCGITPEAVPQSIFRVGSKHKDGSDWQQGTFGLGGATTYRNAQAVVLVSRRHPDLLAKGESDRITVAVVQWERQRTTVNAFYLTSAVWDEDDPSSWPGAVPFSAASASYPAFEPGTHLALIGFDTEGLGRRSGDEKSFDTVTNTRLFRPVLPIRYRNNITRAGRDEILDGLERRLNDNPGPEGAEGNDTLPFRFEGKTYHLPIRFRIFSKPGTRGERRNYVASGHALMITSNGQVHSHWTPQEFKLKSRLNKLYDRVLIVVESDALPVEVRTELFTADRAQLVRSAAAIRLEAEISAFLADWPALADANRALIREAITGDNNDRPTLAIAEKIARALKVKGFSLGGNGSGGGGRGSRTPEPTPPERLYEDPTHFEGPENVEAVAGAVKGVYFKLNAKDGFLGGTGRATLSLRSDHPDIGADEITIGELRGGRVRVSISVPDGAALGTFNLIAKIAQWPKSSGGLGPEFEWVTRMEVIDQTRPRPGSGGTSGGDTGNNGPTGGGLVALIWKSDEDEGSEWTPATVGAIEMVSAADLAATRAEYKDLAGVPGDVPTVVLNRTFSPLKTYVQARAAELTDEGKEQARERYAVGVGVGLLMLDQEAQKAAKAGAPLPDLSIASGQRAAARAVLSVMPDYDKLARQLED
ncbi:ATP-binding protein [Microbacterium sp. BK668]|uniref:ATP-binding protein n=1 Tax=Microbacterium sp. BK668 TaxID=2512118 RepID=UPI00105D79F6|nr:ATP-binding protein [Microbacterium sp. BK668]TDN92216.1 hypothetical protein EV279_1734 [Microbacterium sp. BK668]